MAKKVISLNEEDLRNLIENTVRRFVTENFDEVLDTPERALHAVHAADADRKKHPGRSKLSKDPEIRAKRERQARLFGDKAAELMNQDMNNPDFMVTGGERGPRTLYMAKGKDSAYLRPDTDFPNAKVYNDDFKDGDTPRTMSDLDPDAYADAEAMFNKFKGYHDRAKELDDKYLEEIVRKAVKKVIKESNFGIDPAAKMLYVSGEKDGGVIAFDPKTRRKAFIPREEILSNNPEDIIRVSAGTFAKYFG